MLTGILQFIWNIVVTFYTHAEITLMTSRRHHPGYFLLRSQRRRHTIMTSKLIFMCKFSGVTLQNKEMDKMRMWSVDYIILLKKTSLQEMTSFIQSITASTC